VSTASRQRSSWFGQNYEKLILFVALVSLFGSALFLVLEIGSVREDLAQAKWERPGVPPKEARPADLAPFDAVRESLTKPFQTGEYTNRMMVSELRVSCVECDKPIAFSAAACPFCGAKQPAMLNPEEMDSDGDGLPDKFERDHKLNPLDAADAAMDLDNDGFTNLEECHSGTKIDDASNYPPPIAKLRYARVGSNPFKLRFQGEAKLSDGMRYQLNLRSLERTYFVRLGDEIEGFKAVEFVNDPQEGATIVLQQGDTKVRLVKGKAVERHEMIAELVFLVDLSRHRVRIGDTLKLKGHEYKIVDIKRDGVLIRDVKENKETMVGPLSEAEASDLTRGSETPAQPSFTIPGILRNQP
jgi:hypothetical protein